MGKIVGIDLGTTNSVVAMINKGKSTVVRNREGKESSPSIVTYYMDEVLAGIPAQRYLVMNHENTISSVKRLMGRAFKDEEVTKVAQNYSYRVVKPSDGTGDSLRVVMGGREYAPEEISAFILKKIKEDTEYVLGEEVTHAVITVPAYFSDKQKQATREAGLKAGLKVMKLLDEPMAAALAYGIDRGDHEAQSVLVYDLGGGTFDTTVFVMGAGSFSQQNLEGNMWLGGDNFDQLIVDYVVDEVKAQYRIDPTRDRRFMATLKQEAREAKEALSSSAKTQILIEGRLKDQDGDFIDVKVDLSQEWFRRVSEPLVDLTMKLVDKALEGAHMKPSHINAVVMAGNASAMPLVQEKIIAKFGEDKIRREIHPKHSVAMGAAIHAATYGKIQCPRCSRHNELDAVQCAYCGLDLVNVPKTKTCPQCTTENELSAAKCVKCGFVFDPILKAPFDYAIETAGDNFIPFVRKGDIVPTLSEKIEPITVYTRFFDHQLVSFPYYGMTEPKEKQGEAMAILPPGCAAQTPIHLTCWLGKLGTVEIEARLDGNGEPLTAWVLRGGKDQLVVETMLAAEGKLAENKHIVEAQQIQEIDARKRDVIESMKKKAFDEAHMNVQALKRQVDLIGAGDDPIRNLIANVRYIAEEYNWLLDARQADRLTTCADTLEDAILRGDEEACNRAMADLMEELENVPALIHDFFGWRAKIGMEIRPFNPAMANQLSEEAYQVENAYKQKSVDALQMKQQFESRLNAAVTALGQKNAIKCPKCGLMNPRGRQNCENENCRANLLIADGQLGAQLRMINT